MAAPTTQCDLGDLLRLGGGEGVRLYSLHRGAIGRVAVKWLVTRRAFASARMRQCRDLIDDVLAARGVTTVGSQGGPASGQCATLVRVYGVDAAPPVVVGGGAGRLLCLVRCSSRLQSLYVAGSNRTDPRETRASDKPPTLSSTTLAMSLLMDAVGGFGRGRAGGTHGAEGGRGLKNKTKASSSRGPRQTTDRRRTVSTS